MRILAYKFRIILIDMASSARCHVLNEKTVWYTAFTRTTKYTAKS